MVNDKIVKICEQKFAYLNYSNKTKDIYLYYIKLISKLAGHSSVKTTEIYTHVSTNLLKNINLPV